jgi:hypothetical protein
MRDALGTYIDQFPRAWITTGAGAARAGGKCAEAADLDAAAVSKPGRDSVEERRHDGLDVARGQIGVLCAKRFHKVGSDHGWFLVDIAAFYWLASHCSTKRGSVVRAWSRCSAPAMSCWARRNTPAILASRNRGY